MYEMIMIIIVLFFSALKQRDNSHRDTHTHTHTHTHIKKHTLTRKHTYTSTHTYIREKATRRS